MTDSRILRTDALTLLASELREFERVYNDDALTRDPSAYELTASIILKHITIPAEATAHVT